MAVVVRRGGEDGNISAHFKVHVHFHDTEQRAQNSTSIIINMILFLVGEGGGITDCYNGRNLQTLKPTGKGSI